MKQHLSTMSQGSMPLGGQSPHMRRDSSQSLHNEMGNHGGQGPNRGGYQHQAGRGRGPSYNNNGQYGNQSMPYAPAGQFPRAPAGPGRANMPPQFRGGANMPAFPNSPQPHRASPALAHAMPNQGPQHMQPPMPVPGAPQYQAYQYAPPGGGYPTAQVNLPASSQDQSFLKPGKKKGGRRDAERLSQHPRHPDSALKRMSQNDVNGRSRRPSKRWEATEELRPPSSALQASRPPELFFVPESLMQSHTAPVSCFPKPVDDLSPASGNFDRLLTARKQNYPPYPQQYGPGQMGQMSGYPTYAQIPPYMNTPSQSPSPGFPAPFAGGQFNPPAPQPMSRNPSQVSERPSSSTGQVQGPVIAQGSSQPNASQPKATPIVSSHFQKAQSRAIVIKNAQGETIDLSNLNSLKAPASPAPSVQPSKTPPAIVSTPTPPPKPATPSHARSESTAAAKTAEQLRNEFKEQVRKSTETPTAETKTQDKDIPAAAEDTKAKPEEPSKKEEAPTEAPGTDTKTAAEEAEPKAAAAAPTAEPSAAPAAAPEQPEKAAEAPVEDEEDEFERQIREMEEMEAKREAEEAAYNEKKKVRDEEAKKRAEVQRLADAAENDRKLKEQEREMERLEEEKERRRAESEAKGGAASKTMSVQELLGKKLDDLSPSDKKDSTPSTPDAVAAKLGDLKIGSTDVSAAGSPAEPATSKPGAEKQRAKPSALNLAPLVTNAVEPPQPSAALQSLKTARFINIKDKILYPEGIASPNPALNSAVTRKGNFKYDTGFLLQFKNVFTEKPSVDFDQQLKNLIGDGDNGSRSASRTTPGGAGGRSGSRNAAPGFPAMGAFGTTKPMRPGSEQQFGIPGGSLPRPNMGPMASFGRPGSFPGPSAMSRTPSSSAMGMPNSPRQGSRSTRGSKRDTYNAKAEAQAAKTMPLTQGQEVKPITVSATGWKPMSISNKVVHNPTAAAAQTATLDPATVQRKVKAALNKMTPEKFDKISDQILAIALQSKDEEDGRTLRQVIQLTFEKATDEAHWASMYAKFCKRMLDMMSPEIRDTTILDKNGNVVSGGALFRKYLLNRCQEEFERGWKIDLPKPKEGENKEAVMMSDEYYEAAAAKRRGLGLVQFIGELYKLSMLTERIMHECVRKLVDYNGTPDEAEIESLSKLLRTIGANLDSTEKGKPMMDAYFARIQNIIDLPDLPSRLKFMLMDVVDLRRNHWVSNEANKGPKTLEEVRQDAEAQAAQKAAENARSSQRGPPGGRPPIGRGDARLISGYNQPAPHQMDMNDLRRLKGSAARTSSANVTLGPTSMFASRSNSGRRMAPGGALARAGEESGTSSRTGTPPTRDATSHSNAFQ